MLKTFVKIVAVLMIAVSAHAGTIGGDTTGRLYNTAYYDIMVENSSTMMEYIKYSKRGGFDVDDFNKMLTGFGKNATISIKCRVVIPADVTTTRVYVSVGPEHEYGLDIWGGGDHEIHLNSYWNDEKQIKEIVQLDTKQDAFGNRYVDYKLEGFLRHGMKGEHTKISNIFNTLRFQVAPVKRGFNDKFQKTDIYVLDE